MDKNWNKQNKMKQTPMLCFLTSTALSSLETSSTESELSIASPSEAASLAAFSVAVSTSVSHRNMTFQGALQNYIKYTMQQHLRSFHINAEIEYDSEYRTGFFGVNVNFSKCCNDTNGSKRNGNIFRCKYCHELRQRIGFKI